ncbi:hypothetical protein EV424DRAFT_1333215 [Suillus variegatus]|nr:hypothetical protein EV424DRAFT_1333215 [Suillus variegatus]
MDPYESQDTDDLIPLSQLLDAVTSSRTYQVQVASSEDLYKDLQVALANGNHLFSMPLKPMSSEMGYEADAHDFGIELQGSHLFSSCAQQMESVSPTNPHYPWPSKAHFITALLFNSPRLPFSEAQKKALLHWARELGMQDVPSLKAVKQWKAHVKAVVGDPTKQVTTRSGNIFYINDVANAIAKNYANPLTWFAMQDYPEDGGKGMSQVFNGTKMLLDSSCPSPPAVQVEGKIYFVNELLQEVSGDYFIPEWFFFVSYPSTDPQRDADQLIGQWQLYALGRATHWCGYNNPAEWQGQYVGSCRT